MRKARTIICLVVLALTIPAAVTLRRALPPNRQPMIERKYGGWSGVLRLWVREGWQGGCAAWLNRCISTYERQHPGVYVQPEYVDAGALTAEGMPSPDLILFPPGALDGDGLATLDIDAPLRNGLPRDNRAAPIMLGGYLWACNADLLPGGIPGSWREAGVSIAVPENDADRQWGAALLALCSSKYSDAQAGPTDAPRGEIELGLTRDDATPAPPSARGTLSCRLPEDFAFSVDAWQAFINGEAAAMPVTALEIRKLQALSDQGKGPDWRLAAAGDEAFTDQVLYISAFEQDDTEKLVLCQAFIEHLLTDDCQGMLRLIGACSATGADSGYAAGDDLRQIEQLLSDRPLVVPASFDTAWRSDAEAIVREFTDHDGEAAALLGRLAERLRQ